MPFFVKLSLIILVPQFNENLVPQFNENLVPQFNENLVPQFNENKMRPNFKCVTRVYCAFSWCSR